MPYRLKTARRGFYARQPHAHCRRAAWAAGRPARALDRYDLAARIDASRLYAELTAAGIVPPSRRQERQLARAEATRATYLRAIVGR